MSDFVYLNFETDNPIIKTKAIKVKTDLNIEDALLSFFRETSSIRTLDFTNLFFIYNAKILNTPQNLKKKLNEIFRYHRYHVIFTIKVMGTRRIVGGIFSFK